MQNELLCLSLKSQKTWRRAGAFNPKAKPHMDMPVSMDLLKAPALWRQIRGLYWTWTWTRILSRESGVSGHVSGLLLRFAVAIHHATFLVLYFDSLLHQLSADGGITLCWYSP